MAASSVEKLGMSITCEASPARPMPVPSPSRAVTIGRPIATNEPNVTSSTMIAASRPDGGGRPEGGLLHLFDRLAAERDLELSA